MLGASRKIKVWSLIINSEPVKFSIICCQLLNGSVTNPAFQGFSRKSSLNVVRFLATIHKLYVHFDFHFGGSPGVYHCIFMAFFNLTQLGVQDPLKQSLKEPPTRNHEDIGYEKGDATSLKSTKHTPQSSHVIYTQRLTKHQRPCHAPNEIYRKPITASQEHGWWIDKNEDGSKSNGLDWTKVERHVRINSEMTRFVDEMTLTNKQFSLFWK